MYNNISIYRDTQDIVVDIDYRNRGILDTITISLGDQLQNNVVVTYHHDGNDVTLLDLSYFGDDVVWSSPHPIDLQPDDYIIIHSDYKATVTVSIGKG